MCVYLYSHFVTTTAFGLHSFCSFLQDGNDVQYFNTNSDYAAGTNETFDH